MMLDDGGELTLREFRMWLDGLLSANERPEDLPTRDQWRKILMMLERIGEAPAKESAAFGSSSVQTGRWATSTFSAATAENVPSVLQALQAGGVFLR